MINKYIWKKVERIVGYISKKHAQNDNFLCIMMYYLMILCVTMCIILAKEVKTLTEKMTVLNIRMSAEEKEELKERATESGDSISSYARKILFQEDNTGDYIDNTNVIQEKDERISDLKTQIDDYKKQIEQLHTIILATQKDNQLLIEQKTKRWWKFWK